MTGAKVLASVVIVAFVLAQFVDVTILSVAGIPVTVQKVAAAVVCPLYLLSSRLLRGYRVIGSSLALVIVAYSMVLVERPEVWPGVVVGDVEALFGALGGLILLNALVERADGLVLLARTWILFSVPSAVLSLCQAFRIVPMWSVDQSALSYYYVLRGMYLRGVGLRVDPNFEALSLVLGLAAACALLRGFTRLAVVGVIYLGIVSTFSRMGLLVGFVVLLWWVGMGWPRWGAVRSRMAWVAGLVLLALLAGLGLSVAEPQVLGVLGSRAVQAGEAVTEAVTGESPGTHGQLTSAEVRYLLARTALVLGMENWWHGLGAHQIENSIGAQFPGVKALKNVSHNTYIEFFAIGGIWGILFMAQYFAWVRSGRRSIRGHDSSDAGVAYGYLLIAAIAMMAFFLSLTYTSVMWLPLVVSLAWTFRRRSQFDESCA